MPNWTENDITFVCKTKESADQLKSLLESKEQKFDFNNITPMPIEIKETVSGSENCKPDWQKEQSEELIKNMDMIIGVIGVMINGVQSGMPVI